MRVDEEGNTCPATLGEYRDLCASIGGEGCQAVKILNDHIAKDPDGREALVHAPDLQMRALLMPLLIIPAASNGLAGSVDDPPLN